MSVYSKVIIDIKTYILKQREREGGREGETERGEERKRERERPSMSKQTKHVLVLKLLILIFAD